MPRRNKTTTKLRPRATSPTKLRIRTLSSAELNNGQGKLEVPASTTPGAGRNATFSHVKKTPQSGTSGSQGHRMTTRAILRSSSYCKDIYYNVEALDHLTMGFPPRAVNIEFLKRPEYFHIPAQRQEIHADHSPFSIQTACIQIRKPRWTVEAVLSRRDTSGWQLNPDNT